MTKNLITKPMIIVALLFAVCFLGFKALKAYQYHFSTKAELVKYLKKVTDNDKKKLPIVDSIEPNRRGSITWTKAELNDLTLTYTYVIGKDCIEKSKKYIEMNKKIAFEKLCPDLIAIKNYDVENRFIYTDQNDKVFEDFIVNKKVCKTI